MPTRPSPHHQLRDAIGVLVGRLQLAYEAADRDDLDRVRHHLRIALKKEADVLSWLAVVERGPRR